MNKIDSKMKMIVDWESHQESIRYWMRLKGALKYSIAIHYLKDRNIDPTYAKVSRLYKTDKKINYLLQRFLSFFEEFLKAGLTNHFELPISRDQKEFHKYLENHFPDISEEHTAILFKLKKKKRITTWFDLVENMSLSNVVFHILQMDKKLLKEIYELEFEDKNKLESIIDLRNAVAHNRFLLDYDYINDFSDNRHDCNLYGHVHVFASFLPVSHKDGTIEHEGLLKEFQTIYKDLINIG